jgi:hypothetical protein
MRWNWQSVVVYVLVALAALGLNASFAQSAQERVSAAHDLVPAGDGFGPYEVDGMGPDPAPAGYGGGTEQWRPAVEGACGGDAGCVNWMMTVIACESGGDHSAVGYYGEVGILQFRPDGLWGAVSDAGTQISIAADAYFSGLRHHWTCSPW